MLPFGSITSIIPLFILAIAYTLFAGTTFLNKIKPPQAGAEEKTIAVKSTVPAHSQKTVHLSELLFVKSPGNTSDQNQIQEYKQFSLVDLQTHILFSGYPNHLFSRPPPAFFS